VARAGHVKPVESTVSHVSSCEATENEALSAV